MQKLNKYRFMHYGYSISPNFNILLKCYFKRYKKVVRITKPVKIYSAASEKRIRIENPIFFNNPVHI